MGWYHVNRTGKGFFLGSTIALPIHMDPLLKYLPEREEVKQEYAKIPERFLATYDEWPDLWKFAALDERMRWNWREGRTDWFEDSEHEILVGAMHYCFEKKYGYPYNSFVSVSDYDGNAMIFCSAKWPPEKYNEALAILTEEKLRDQLREFLSEVIDLDVSNQMLEMCEEYIKE